VRRYEFKFKTITENAALAEVLARRLRACRGLDSARIYCGRGSCNIMPLP